MRCPRKNIKMMNCRKAPLICLVVFGSAVFSLYMVFFNHGPPEEILAANRKVEDGRTKRENGDGHISQSDSKDMQNELYVESLNRWSNFIEQNKFVSIGEIFDHCDEGDRVLLGKVIMLPDKKLGGVKSRSFLNITFEDEGYTSGEMNLDVKYNGQSLYDNKWDMCTLDEDEDDDGDDVPRIIFCPYKPQPYSWVIDRKIPNFLPKGKYTTKAWVTDQTGSVIVCAFAEFVL